MNKINYTTREFLDYFKENFTEKFLPWYQAGDKDQILNYFNDNVIEGQFDFEYQSITSDNYVENIKTVFGQLEELPPTMAAKEEFWLAMINTYFIDYLLSEIKNFKSENFDEQVKNALFFNFGPKNSLQTQILAKYWWSGFHLYDDQAINNPYWLAQYLANDDAESNAIIYFAHDFTNNKEIALGILAGMNEQKIPATPENFDKITAYFNELGGIEILDIFTRQEIKQKTIEFFQGE